MPPPPVAPKRRPLLVAAAAVVVTLMVLGVGGYAVWANFVRKDSGVAACETMRDNGAAKDDSAAGEKMTEAEYRAVRKQFEDSDNDKIREHGTALVDIAWQIDQMPEGEEMGALAFLAPMGTHISGLQTACADLGIMVNLSK
jgi:hypothetical protein